MELPERIRSILVEDETVEGRFRLKDATVYTTGRRLIEHSGRSVIGCDYADIAAVSRTIGRFRWLLIPGIAFVMAGAAAGYLGVTQSLFPESASLAVAGASLAVGLIVSVVGAVARSERLEVSLSDGSRVIYMGSEDRLLSLMQAIRRKGGVKPPVAARSDEEDEVSGFAATLALMADLRDKGGISAEGFERIEQEIRRPSVPGGSGVAVEIDAGRQASERSGAGVESDDSPEKQDEGPQAVKSEILTALARDASHGAFDGAGSLAEAATRAGASTNEIAEALGVTQFSWAIGSLYRSAAALGEPSIAGASSID